MFKDPEEMFLKFMEISYSDNPVENRINLFNQVRDIPYRTVSVHSWEEVLEKNIGGCGAKHRLLKKCFDSLGYKCRFAYVPYSWNEIESVPADLRSGSQYNRRDLHTFLEVKIDGKWTIVDATWNKELKDVFPVNLNWDGFADTIVAVPSEKIYHADKNDTDQLRAELNCSKDGIPSPEEITWVGKFNHWVDSFRSNQNE